MSTSLSASMRDRAQPNPSSTREQLRSTLHRLAPASSSTSRDVVDDAQPGIAEEEEEDDEQEEVGDGEEDDALAEEDEDAVEPDDDDAADEEEKRVDHSSDGRPSTPPSPRPSDSAYSQYISRHRSRYSYSPTPRSPRSPHSPTSHPPGRQSPSPMNHRPPSRNQLEPPSPTSPAPLPRRAPPMSITVSNPHTSSPAAAAADPTLPSSPTKRTRARSQSTLSSPSPSPTSPSVSSLSVQLAKAQSVIAERENDIKLAAQIGEMIMEDNEKMERLMEEMRVDMADREERERQAREEVKKLRATIDQLRQQNIHLVTTAHPPNSSAPPTPSIDATSSLKAPSSAASIQDFLRQELTSTAAAPGGGGGGGGSSGAGGAGVRCIPGM